MDDVYLGGTGTNAGVAGGGVILRSTISKEHAVKPAPVDN